MVLSLFPGADLLGRAFELEAPQFCLVRGPDKVWGGNVKGWHVPAGVFAGVIGGPPCQFASRFQHLVRMNREKRRAQGRGGYDEAENLIPEFERIVAEAQPRWFLMENVPKAPVPRVPGYVTASQLVADVWVGGETRRQRRFTFGMIETAGNRLKVPRFTVEQLALHRPDPLPAVCASGARWVPAKIGGSGKVKRTAKGRNGREDVSLHDGRVWGYRTKKYLTEAIAAHGLPADFLKDSPLTVAGKISLIGNGVPLALGRAIARAVLQVVE